jgi:hypothetical protein
LLNVGELNVLPFKAKKHHATIDELGAKADANCAVLLPRPKHLVSASLQTLHVLDSPISVNDRVEQHCSSLMSRR